MAIKMGLAQRLQLKVAILARHDAHASTSRQERLKMPLLQKLRSYFQSRLRSPPIFVSFNAWQHDKDEALWASFALAFARGAVPRAPVKRLYMATVLAFKRLKWGAELIRLTLAFLLGLSLVVWIADLILNPQLLPDKVTETAKWGAYLQERLTRVLALSPVAVVIAMWKSTARAPLNTVKEAIAAPKYDERIGFLERFVEDFKRYVDTYVGERRAFVLVDDLDRCEVPKAAELLQALNLMLASNPPLIVVLAMDRPKIAAGVAVRHKELLPFLPRPSEPRGDASSDDAATGIAHGYEFVEKFVQLSLRVPRLTQGTLRVFLDALTAQRQPQATPPRQLDVDPADLIASDSPEVRRVLDLVAPMLGLNPRRIKQFLNLFRLRHVVAWKTGQLRRAQDVDWTLLQLGKMVAIELRRPELLDALLDQPGALAELLRAIRGETLPEDSTGAEWANDHALMALLRSPAEREVDSTDFDWLGLLLSRLYGADAPPSAGRPTASV